MRASICQASRPHLPFCQPTFKAVEGRQPTSCTLVSSCTTGYVGVEREPGWGCKVRGGGITRSREYPTEVLSSSGEVGGINDNQRMTVSWKGYRFPPEDLSCAIWLYHRFAPSLRDVEDIVTKRGMLVTHEIIRFWCSKFEFTFARRLRKRAVPIG